MMMTARSIEGATAKSALNPSKGATCAFFRTGVVERDERDLRDEPR